MDAYRGSLARRLDPAAGFLQMITAGLQAAPPRRIVFAEGEEPAVIRAAHAFQSQGLGKAVLVGREELVAQNMRQVGLDPAQAGLEVINARVSGHNAEFVDFLYQRLQRAGYLRRDVQRLINQDRNSFAACMVARGRADGLVTGVTRNFNQVLEEVLRVVDPAPRGRVLGMTIVLAKGQTLFIADTNVTEFPEPEELVEIACETAATVQTARLHAPGRFHVLFGLRQPRGPRSSRVRQAVGPSGTRAATSTSNTKARCRPNWPSIRSRERTILSCV